MIKRLNLRNFNGIWAFTGQYPKNWVIEIFQEEGFFRVTSLSKASDKNPVTEFPLKEGSLFLRNHTYNFYAFFRDRKEQSLMDHFDIIKVVVLPEGEDPSIHISEINSEVVTPIVYMRGVEITEVKNLEFDVTDESKTMNSSIVKFRFTDDRGFIIQKLYKRDDKDKHFIFLGSKRPLSEILKREDKDTMMKVNTRAIMRLGK